MATERGPIKVPCENEDLPEKENAAGEDSLRGELGSTLTSNCHLAFCLSWGSYLSFLSSCT